MKKLIILFHAVLVFKFAAGQCTNVSPSNTATIQHNCFQQSFFGGTGRFNALTLSGAIAGDEYKFTSSAATDFLTLRSASGTLLASGISPLIFTQPATVETSVRLHVNENSGCGTNFIPRALTAGLNNNCPPPPANDNCTSAQVLAVGTASACSSLVSGTTANATESQIACTGSADDDVWYSFVAASTEHKIIVQSAANGGISDPVVEIFSGTCGSLNSIGCSSPVLSDNNTFIKAGLTVGNTYFIRVHSFASTFASIGSFDICVSTPATPVNSDCSNATPLTVNSNSACSNITAGTTVDGGESLPGCTGTADDDVWYSFTATATSHKITVNSAAAGGLTFPIVQLFSGNCATLTSLRCNSFTSSSSNVFSQSGLTIGTTYFVRVHSQESDESSQGAFTICVNTPVLPANDNCSGAIALAVNGGSACSAISTGSSFDASQSQPACSGNADDDVWYSFVATATTHKVLVSSTATEGIASPVVQIFSGSCAGLVSITCNQPQSNNLNSLLQNGLTTGTTYFIRVYSFSSSISQQGNFTICVTTPNVPNDECAGAIPLPVNTGNSCLSITEGSTVDATQSQAGCAGTADDDVWFSFVATAASHKISIEAAAVGGIVLPEVQLFSGSCPGLVSLGCNTSATVFKNIFIQNGLTAGNTYFVRVYSNQGSVVSQGAFTICIGVPVVPANDECANAIVLPVNNFNDCTNTVSGNTSDASLSFAGCAGNADDDVWYKFVATSTAHKVVITTTGAGAIAAGVAELFTGACGTLTSLSCNSADTINQAGLTIGNTYFLRVFSQGTGLSTQGSFNICLSELNDNCENAVSIPVNTGVNCINSVSANNVFATQSQPGCAGTADDDVWFKFVAAAAEQKITVDITSGNFQSAVIELFAGSCGGLTQLKCQAPSQLDKAILLGDDFIVGNTYFIRLYSFTSTTSVRGHFTICVTKALPEEFGAVCNVSRLLTTSVSQAASFINGNTEIFANTPEGNSCGAEGLNDVWYKFTTNSIHNIIKVIPLENNPSIYTSVYKGSCENTAVKLCTSPDTAITFTDMAIGDQYFVRIHAGNRTTGNAYKIAIVKDSVGNNECAAALPIPIAPNSSTSSYFNTTRGATQSLPACNGSSPANDVWFSFTAGLDSFAIEIDHLDTNNINTQLFTGTCGVLSPAACQTLDNIVVVNNPVAGQTYFLRLYSSDGTPVAYFIKAYVKEAVQKNSVFSEACLFTNQVGNAGFESFDVCPTSFVGTATAGNAIVPNWTFPTRGTSDYMNSCSGFNKAIEVPRNNCFGNQSPRSGNGYIGLFGYFDLGYREYIQGNLSASLVPGKRYLVSYYVNLADMSSIAVNKLGVYFSTTPLALDTSKNITFTPQIISPASQFFTDKQNWVNVSAIFTADQPYNFFVIGNFNSNDNTDTVDARYGNIIFNQLSGCASTSSSYVNIDDVSISEINETAVTNNCNVTLPLTLSNFEAVKRGATAYLSWKTVYETNTKKFEVERSSDGYIFNSIGGVPASFFTGSTVKAYNFSDAQPFNGINFYRLKMIDADGRFTYSDIRRLRFDNKEGIAVYPNPAKNAVSVSGLEPNGTLKLYSADGKLLQQITALSKTVLLNISAYAAGTYLMQYEYDGLLQYKKIIKQ